MLYARINLAKTDYEVLEDKKILRKKPIEKLNKIYYQYCKYKKFPSVMPLFDSEYEKNEVIGYYHNGELVAFSIMILHDKHNVEAFQFAWDYAKPKLALGIKSLKSECAYYKKRGFKFLYLGEAHEYKKKIKGFEILGPA